MRGKTKRLIKFVKQRGNEEAVLELRRRTAARKDRRAFSFVNRQSNSKGGSL